MPAVACDFDNLIGIRHQSRYYNISIFPGQKRNVTELICIRPVNDNGRLYGNYFAPGALNRKMQEFVRQEMYFTDDESVYCVCKKI